MSDSSPYFSSKESLVRHLTEMGSGSVRMDYREMEDYPGMVRGMGIIFDVSKKKYELDLEWISFGLDLYGENLLEGVLYSFDSLDALLAYVDAVYGVQVTAIRQQPSTDFSAFPNPIKDAHRKHEMEAAWERFQKNFRAGMFLDRSCVLVYSS